MKFDTICFNFDRLLNHFIFNLHLLLRHSNLKIVGTVVLVTDFCFVIHFRKIAHVWAVTNQYSNYPRSFLQSNGCSAKRIHDHFHMFDFIHFKSILIHLAMRRLECEESIELVLWHHCQDFQFHIIFSPYLMYLWEN